LPHNFDSTSTPADTPKAKIKTRLWRIDFLGAILLTVVIVSFLLVLNIASKKLAVSDPMVLGLCGLWAGSSLLFVLVEARYASEPIFPLQLLLHRDVLTSYLLAFMIIMGQMIVKTLPSTSAAFCN
jgi:hypothetical protein